MSDNSDNMETIDAYYTPPPGYAPPPVEKKTNMGMIIGIIVLVVLCCFCSVVFLVLAYMFGDQFIEMLGIANLAFGLVV